MPDDPHFNIDRGNARWQMVGGRMRATV
jgi:hypothetical protein